MGARRKYVNSIYTALCTMYTYIPDISTGDRSYTSSSTGEELYVPLRTSQGQYTIILYTGTICILYSWLLFSVNYQLLYISYGRGVSLTKPC